jgi:hypothetical protein
VVDLLAIIPFD